MYDCYYTNLLRNLAVTPYLYFRDTSMFSGLIYKFNDHFKKKSYTALRFANWL